LPTTTSTRSRWKISTGGAARGSARLNELKALRAERFELMARSRSCRAT
jgi:hypothetical protein